MKGVDKTGEALGSARRNLAGFGNDMKAVNAVTALASGNFSSAAASASRFVAGIGGLGMTAPQLALVSGAVSSIVLLVKTLSDRAAEASKNLSRIVSGNLHAGVERLRNSYSRLRSEMELIHKASMVGIKHENDLINAYKQLDTAMLKREMAREISLEKDPEKRKMIEAQYSIKLNNIEATASFRSGERSIKMLEEQLKNAEEAAEEADKQFQKLLETSNRLGNTSLDKFELARNVGWWRSRNIGGNLDSFFVQEGVKLSDSAGAVLKEAIGEMERAKQLRIDATAIRGQIEVQKVTNDANLINLDTEQANAVNNLDELSSSSEKASNVLRDMGRAAEFATASSYDYIKELYGQGGAMDATLGNGAAAGAETVQTVKVVDSEAQKETASWCKIIASDMTWSARYLKDIADNLVKLEAL